MGNDGQVYLSGIARNIMGLNKIRSERISNKVPAASIARVLEEGNEMDIRSFLRNLNSETLGRIIASSPNGLQILKDEAYKVLLEAMVLNVQKDHQREKAAAATHCSPYRDELPGRQFLVDDSPDGGMKV